MKDIKILMTGAGAPGAYGIIQCLRNNGERKIIIVGVDMNDNASCKDIVDVFYQVPKFSDDSFIDSVFEICVKEQVQLILPIVTRELEVFSENIELFNKSNIKVNVLPESILKIVNNKGKLFEELKNKVKMPKFNICQTALDVFQAMEMFNYKEHPICVKACEGNGSRGIRIVDINKSKYDLFFWEKPNSMYISYSELKSTLEERENIPEMMVMEYLPGDEYGVDVLADNGKIIAFAARKSVVVKSSIPLESVTVHDEYLYEFCEKIVSILRLSGNIGFDFKCNKDNIPMLMEINPRLTATIVLNAVAGINFAYLGLKYLLGEEIKIPSFKTGVLMRRRYEERYYYRGKEIFLDDKIHG